MHSTTQLAHRSSVPMQNNSAKSCTIHGFTKIHVRTYADPKTNFLLNIRVNASWTKSLTLLPPPQILITLRIWSTTTSVWVTSLAGNDEVFLTTTTTILRQNPTTTTIPVRWGRFMWVDAEFAKGSRHQKATTRARTFPATRALRLRRMMTPSATTGSGNTSATRKNSI